MKPPRGDNIRPGPAFWLVLIVIGGTTIWQKATAPPEPVTDLSTGKIFSGMKAEITFTRNTGFGTKTGWQKIHAYNFCTGAEMGRHEDTGIAAMVGSAHVT